MIEHYSNLSEEAAKREQKALWKIQRHKLESARIDFLLNDKKKLQVVGQVLILYFNWMTCKVCILKFYCLLDLRLTFSISQAMLDKLPLGEQRETSDVVPGLDLQHHEPLTKGFDSQQLSIEVQYYSCFSSANIYFSSLPSTPNLDNC